MLSLQVCPICKYVSRRTRPFCRYCVDQLARRISPTVRHMDTISTWSLFSWVPGESRIYSDLIYAMKGRESEAPWREFAYWMAQKISPPPRKSAFVPIPGTRPNHARGLASALAAAFRCPMEDVLIHVERSPQKTRDRLNRQGHHFCLRGMNPCRDYRTVILVDDVITTGATITAAFKALGEPKRTEGWCLMDRRPCDEVAPRV